MKLVDICIRNDDGDVPHDDKTSGELMIKGPWIAGHYLGNHTPDRWTARRSI